jgi:glyoxylase-like metal-dependent hydrolase (beta-lactamase superfamily II)/8-oxo-dGTP pyrophosphatase MutT (NUDIX family)
VSTITEAASVLLAAGPGSHEVLLVGRAPTLRFMGGFVAFPGGKVHESDFALAEPAQGLDHLRVSAIRELFEETGVLLTRQPVRGDLAPLRRRLLDNTISFAEVLRQLGLSLNPADLAFAGRLVTPSFAPVRFDTAFFVATLPPGQQADVWPGELTSGRWASAEQALQAWQDDEWFLSPPTVSLLEAIRGRPVDELTQRLPPILARLEDGGRLPAIWFAPDVLMIPLDCQGLPPTTHTNCYLVGSGPRCLLDPGPADPAEQERLFAVLDDLGTRPDLVVLTHHHPDHVGAAVAVVRRYGIPIHAHPLTARRLHNRIGVDTLIEDGDQLALGRLSLTAVFTPGHAPGHLAFFEPRRRLLFAGDMTSTLSSIVILPDDGDLSVYLDSLERLRQLPSRMLLPAHGPPSTRPAHVLAETVAHRQQREEQLIEALAAGPRTVAELAVQVYRGLPARSMRLAELQVETGLLKLHREGKAVRLEDGRWQAG